MPDDEEDMPPTAGAATLRGSPSGGCGQGEDAGGESDRSAGSAMARPLVCCLPRQSAADADPGGEAALNLLFISEIM